MSLNHKLKVVVIDDSTPIRERLELIVNELNGVELVGAAIDAETGLEVIQDSKPDVVTLDIALPRKSGLRLLEDLKGMPASPQVIVLTDYPYQAFRKRCADLGAEHFLSKSSESGKLAGLLEELRDSSSA